MEHTWIVGLDGALARIATTDNTQTLSTESFITLDINPSGLLLDGMFVRGEIILATDSGHRYEIELELVASEGQTTTLEEWTEPSR